MIWILREYERVAIFRQITGRHKGTLDHLFSFRSSIAWVPEMEN